MFNVKASMLGVFFSPASASQLWLYRDSLFVGVVLQVCETVHATRTPTELGSNEQIFCYGSCANCVVVFC